MSSLFHLNTYIYDYEHDIVLSYCSYAVPLQTEETAYDPLTINST